MEKRKDYKDEFVMIDADHNTLGEGPYKVRIDGWWDDINGGVGWGSDQFSGNPAVLWYAFRTGIKGGVPWDDEVLYGHITDDDRHGLGILFHETEIIDEGN